MASIPAEIADAGVKRLLAELSDAIDDIKSLKDNMEKLDAAMDALQACKDELMRKIDARRSIWQGDPRGKVINWLQKVEKLEGCVDKTKEEFDGMMVGCLGDFLSNVFLSWRVSKVAKKWHALATQYGEEYNNFTDADLVTDLGPGVIAERPRGAEMSPEKAYEELKKHIGDHDASIVVIHGIGGVGKSELLERLNREIARIKNRRTWKGEAEEEPMSFERVFWINARDLKGEKEVQKAVVDEMGLTLPAKKTDQNEIAACIYDKVKKNKYLVVLNDVWSPIDLTKVGLPRCESKSKTILTTRMPNVCKSVGARKLKVEGLDREEAWCLFQMSAEWGRIQNDPNLEEEILEPHAKELVESCGGLLSALVTVGKAMSHKDDESQWKNAITELSRAPWMIPGMTANVLEPLKVSYDRLGTEMNLELSCEQKRAMQLQKCFLYCSLYPEGSSIFKDWIVDYCIGEGIIDDAFLEVDEIYNKGRSLIGDLIEASLLERADDPDYVKMHPMVRAMALWIACEKGASPNKWFVPLHKESRGGKSKNSIGRAPDDEIWTEAERISLMRSNIVDLPDSPTCPDLLTLLLQRNDKLKQVPKQFFQFMPFLRVLDLSHTGIGAFPDGICELSSLQYLDLCNTKITSLPEDLRKLSKLMFLLLSHCDLLRRIPRGVISKLSELRVFYIQFSYEDWRFFPTSSSQQSGVLFEELQKLKRLKALGITVKENDLDKFFQYERLCQSTRELHIKGIGNLESEFNLPQISNSDEFGDAAISTDETFESDFNLPQIFNSDEFGGAVISDETLESEFNLPQISNSDEFEDAVISDELLNLRTLVLELLTGNVRSACKEHCLQNLCQLVIVGCFRMEQLVFCDDMEIKEEEGNGAINTLPHLRKLYLIGLPKMERLSNGRRPLSFRALDYLCVRGCPKLKRLTMVAKKPAGKICSELSWWQSLEWECKPARWEHESLQE